MKLRRDYEPRVAVDCYSAFNVCRSFLMRLKQQGTWSNQPKRTNHGVSIRRRSSTVRSCRGGGGEEVRDRCHWTVTPEAPILIFVRQVRGKWRIKMILHHQHSSAKKQDQSLLLWNCLWLAYLRLLLVKVPCTATYHLEMHNFYVMVRVSEQRPASFLILSRRRRMGDRRRDK